MHRGAPVLTLFNEAIVTAKFLRYDACPADIWRMTDRKWRRGSGIGIVAPGIGIAVAEDGAHEFEIVGKVLQCKPAEVLAASSITASSKGVVLPTQRAT